MAKAVSKGGKSGGGSRPKSGPSKKNNFSNKPKKGFKPDF